MSSRVREGCCSSASWRPWSARLMQRRTIRRRYDAARLRLRMLEDAKRVGELVYLADAFAGAMIGDRIWREASAEQIRA